MNAPTDATMYFWLRFLRLGFVVFALESVLVGAYALSTPNGEHRALLEVIAVGAVAIAGVNLLAVPWIAQQPWHRSFSVAWTLLSGAAAAACVVIDGGLGSPLVALLLLPLMFGSLAFEPVMIGVCGLASFVEVLGLGVLESDDARPGTFLIVTGATGGVAIVVWSTSVHRYRLQRQADALTRELEVLATTDDLTGCLNHRSFFARLDDEIERARRYGHAMSLLVADVDSFKTLNDTFGHGAGDAALRLAGQTLRSRSRVNDVVARIGGDEFAILLPETVLDDAVEQARRLFGPSSTGDRRLSFSVGVSMLPVDEPTADRIFRDADSAMYHAKHTGRDGIASLSPAGVMARIAAA